MPSVIAARPRPRKDRCASKRPQDGREYPLIDWTVARVGRDRAVGVACPDCFALSGEGCEVGFTLLRSPAFAWHDPAVLKRSRTHRPPARFDWTKGMLP
jgi:hypothetical protein